MSEKQFLGSDNNWYKYCSKCDTFLQLEHFGKSGKLSYCLECKRGVSKKWFEKNRQSRKKYSHNYYLTHRDRMRETNRIWKENNAEYLQKMRHDRYRRNREKCLKQSKEFHKKNPEYIKKWNKVKDPDGTGYLTRLYEAALKKVEMSSGRELIYAARGAVNVAIQLGFLERPRFCCECGEEKKLDAHHTNYKEPLKVMFLCRKCHKMLHSILNLYKK